MLPGLKHRRRWPVQHPIGNCSPDPRYTRSDDCRREEAKNVARPSEVETRTEVVLDQSSCNQGLCPVAEALGDARPQGVLDDDVGRNSRAYDAGQHRPSCASKNDQKA